MSFSSPEFLASALLLLPILWLAGRRRSTLGHSQVGLHKNLRSVPLLGRLPATLLVLLSIVLAAAMAGPQLAEHSDRTTVQTRNYLLVVDVSGSMDQKLTVKDQQDFVGDPKFTATTGDTSNSTAPAKPPTRATAAEAGARLFATNPNRKGDRIGVILFNDQPYNVWPLTLDLNTIQRKLFLISKYNAGGTNFDGPHESDENTGGVQAGINHLLEITKPDETRVLIIVTDGEDAINPRRYTELVAELNKHHIKLYVLGVGESWGANKKTDIQLLAEDAGGIVIPVGDTQAMQDGFAKIDKLEKKTTQVDPITTYRDISDWFLGTAILLALLYLGSIVLVRDDA